MRLKIKPFFFIKNVFLLTFNPAITSIKHPFIKALHTEGSRMYPKYYQYIRTVLEKSILKIRD
jgi:hypothetical protein